MARDCLKMIYKFRMIAKSGRWEHQPRRSAAVGVPTNRKMVNENFIFRQPLRSLIKNFKLIGVLFTGILFFNFSKDNSSKNINVNKMDSFPSKGFLFGDDQPYPECHASTIIHLKNGDFIAAWFGGTKEKDDDVGIWMTKGKPGAWGKAYEAAKINNEPHWNPVLFQSPEGKIFLFFKVGKEIPQWETWVKTSDDEGNTWTEAKELVKGDHGGRGPVRNKMIVLSDGTWLAGASNEQGLWNAFFDRSDDEGRTWEATPYLQIDRKEISGKGIIQPTLWESSPGDVHALLRSSSGIICRSDSKDYGKTWSPVYKTSLPNPNSGIDVAKLSDGTLVLAYNPTTKDWGSRGKLALAISFDNGKTWPKKIDLENGKRKEEFSYPAIINFNDTIAVTYTYNRKRIAYWMATKDWILKNAVSF